LFLFPYQVIGDDGGYQLAVESLDKGEGYFYKQTATTPNPIVSNSYVIGQEVVEKRTENSKTTYLGKVGNKEKYALEVSMGPIHYKDNYNDPNEQWKDIDLTWENGKITKAPYELTVDGNSITVRDKKTNSIVALTLSEIGGKSIGKHSLEYLKGKAVAKDIALDTDLEITATNTNVQFSRILKTSAAAKEAKFGFSKVGGGISVRCVGEDSSVGENKNIKVESSIKDGVLTETVNDVGLAYPVKIDPSITVQLASANASCNVYWDTGFAWAYASGVYCYVGRTTFGTRERDGGGLLFQSVSIPQGSSISTAYINFTARLADIQFTTYSRLTGEDVDNARLFANLTDYQTRRGTAVGGASNIYLTSANVSWTMDGWTTVNATYQSPSIVTIVQEIVSRVGWASGNSMNIFFDDHESRSSSDNRVRRAWNFYDDSSKSPKLYIVYISSAIVSTLNASDVEETTATVGGNVTEMGGGNITSYGIQYGLSTSYGSWCNHTETKTAIFTWNCYLGTNTSSLTQGLLYYYRAWTYDNTYGYGYGSQLTFLTKPEAPTGFVCTTVNSTAISYVWVKGTGADYTYIRYKDGGYPANVADGIESYNGTGTSNTQSGLTDGHTYYFRGWSWVSNTTLTQYSDGYDGCFSTTYDPPIVTTTAASLVEETTATTGGNIVSSPFAITTWGVQYGTTSSYGSWANTSSNPGLPYAFSKNLTSLSKGTFYYFRAFAEHASGAGYGAQNTFLTKPDPPVLAVTALNASAVTLSWIVGDGADYTYIRYRTVSCPATIADGTLAGNISAPTASLIVSNLTTLQTYYFSAWSHSTGGATYQFSDTYDCESQQVPGLPTVTTNAPTGYGNDWASVSGTQTGGYPVSTLFGFQYGTTIGYGSWSNTTITVAGGSFSATISGLTPSSSYHYRAFAVNPYGVGYGADMTFSTAGTAILYENHQYGCNTTWSQVYDTDSTSISANWTSGTIASYSTQPVFGNNWTAQTFTTTQAHSVHQVVLWMSRTTTAAAGYVYVSIREATTDNVTSPDLGLGLYAIAYVPANGGPCEVSLENEIQLDASKKYAIVVRAPSADATNYVSIWGSAAATSIYATGNAIRSITGGASWVTQDYDVFFSIIGRPQPIYGNIQAAQSFTVGTTPHTAYKVRLILGRIGQPGNIYVSIRNYSGGVISNADLAVVALNGNAITLDKAMYDCVLVPEKSLEASKQYAIIVSAPSGDRYNYILMCADVGAGYADGTALLSSDSGLTWVAQAYDYNFEVWGNACLNVLNAKVFRNYLVSGDWLIVSETLNVSPPYYDANQDPSTLFILSFMGLAGTTYASTPCELWEKGPIAIYLNPTQASALTWGGNYKVRLSNIGGTIYSEYGLISTDWSSSSLVYLDNWVRLVAKDMESYQTTRTGTTVTYLTYVADKGYVLNQDGGAIFNQACPRLSYVRPDLFQITSNQPDITTTPVTTTSVDYHVILGSYLSGLIDQGAGAMGIGDAKAAGGIMIVAIYAIIAFGTVIKGFAWAGMIAAFPIILLGMYYGLLDMGMILVMLVILVFLFVREFFMKGG